MHDPDPPQRRAHGASKAMFLSRLGNATASWLKAESALAGQRSFWNSSSIVFSTVLTILGGAVISPHIQDLGSGSQVDYPSLVFGLSLILFGIYLAQRSRSLQTKRENAIKDINIGSLQKFIDPLSDMHSAVADLVQSEQSKDDIDRYFKSVAAAGAQLFPTESARACIYKLDGPEAYDSATEPAGRVLTLRDHAGRSDSPRQRFTDSEAHGQEFIESALDTVPKPVDDARNADIAVNRKRTSRWRSFVIFPVVHKSTHYGAVSIDSPQPVRYGDEHFTIGMMIAQLVSLGERLAIEAGRQTTPERREAREQLGELRRSHQKGARRPSIGTTWSKIRRTRRGGDQW